MFAKVISILTIKVIFKAKDLGWEFIKESKKTRKHALIQEKKELVQKKENSLKKTRSRPRKRQRNQRKNFLFFLHRFLGRFLFS